MNALAQRAWLNLGLLGLVGGLAALALFDPGRENPALISPLLDLAPAHIERIAVERPGQDALAFEQRAGRWWMTEPDNGPANPVLIRSILQLAEARCPLRYATAGLDLKPLGLDPSQLQLRLNDRSIHFGATAPTDGQRYLRIGATVYLCPDRSYLLLTSAAAGFLASPVELPAVNATRRE
ncbi:MAG: hypothetical protein JNK95_02780 [Candidatus Competibacter sp.]|nr:hypothetical protein [Candidatus Competibacter sp.]MDG4607434.1 hypothetical protein [Candidatus Contendobacter sp.]HRD50468.1 hypothetical protein [Candidatus Contendobacter sp.]